MQGPYILFKLQEPQPTLAFPLLASLLLQLPFPLAPQLPQPRPPFAPQLQLPLPQLQSPLLVFASSRNELDEPTGI